MAMIGAQAFSVGGKPGADYLIFGAREEYVAVFRVSGWVVRNESAEVAADGVRIGEFT